MISRWNCMSDNAAADLIRKLVDTMSGPSVDGDGWASMAMILEFPDGTFNEAHGYLYSADGTISAVAADPWAVTAAVRANCVRRSADLRPPPAHG
jgi:hypothetical protein